MRVYIALGSNLESREEYLRSGLRGLVSRDVIVTRTASLYSTEPRDILDQPWFLNTVIEADTQLGPEELLADRRRLIRGHTPAYSYYPQQECELGI